LIDDLRYLVLIAEYGTFTSAARHAHLSQPALTAAMHRLEDAFGAPLLHRGRHGATLTAAGAALLPRARAAIAALEDGRRAVREIMGLAAGEVRLGASATAATYLLPPELALFRKRHPGVRIVLRELQPAAIDDLVGIGEIDLGVVTGPGGELWRRDEFVLVGARGASLEAPVVTFAPGSSTRAALDRWFPDATIVMELGSIAAVKGHVRQGIGIALVSRAAVASDLAAGRLVELSHPLVPIARDLVLKHRGVERLPPAAAALRELLMASADAAKPRGSRKR
jgi:DNA-binding transcriptional LysR family regulator